MAEAAHGTMASMTDETTKPEPVENRILPPWVFVVSALASFILGIAGMFHEADSDTYTLFGMYFAATFFLAPALLIYPVVRFFVGEGKPVISALISALFGAWVQSSVKKIGQNDRK